MARQWKVFDNWEGGGYFADGSFDGKGRFRSLNMQRYLNGSIGPRPQWRKLTQSADGASSIPSSPAVTYPNLKHGSTWTSYARVGWEYGAVLLEAGGGVGLNRRIQINADGTAVYFAVTEIGQFSVGPTNFKSVTEATGIHAIQNVTDGSAPVYIGGSLKYNPSDDVISNVTGRTISAVVFYPNKLVLYKNRMYGWQPINNTTSPEFIVVSNTNAVDDFAGGDSGEFRLSVAPAGFKPGLPRGMWSLASGLLIFTTEGPISQTPNYEGVSSAYGNNYADFGRWYLLVGQNPSVGTLTPVEAGMGPLFYSLSVVYNGKVMFPVHAKGWAIHDGATLDLTTLAGLRPTMWQSDFNLGLSWLHPFVVPEGNNLVLPFFINLRDVTTDHLITDGGDSIGEFFSQGYGGYEFVNGAWTEHLYWHGQGNLAAMEQFDKNKLYAINLDSSDSGTNYFPQIYTRDLTLNRPSSSASFTGNSAANPFSDNTENAVVYAPPSATGGGATGAMKCFVETAEEQAPDFGTVEVDAVVVEYDYWNANGFDQDCGFNVTFVYRGSQGGNKVEHLLTESGRVVPPGLSVASTPNRARFYANLPHKIAAGSYQVRVHDIVGCAIHAVAVANDGGFVHV